MIPLWILLSLLLVLGCSENPNQGSEDQPREEQTVSSLNPALVQVPAQIRDRIQTAVIAEQLIPQTVTAPGEVALDLAKVAKISSRIGGQVEKIFVELGDRVQNGQPLAAVGSLKLDELIQEFLVSRVQLNVAKTNFLRTQNLFDEQVVSKRRLLEDRGQYLKSKAVYQHVAEKLQNMGLTSTELQELVQGSHIHGHHYLLKAPLEGTIASQTVVLGQGVLPGNELFQIVDTSQVWVFANLPVEQVRRFKAGDQGTILPKGRDPIEAVLAYISPVADKATLTVRLRFDVDNHKGVLKPHEYVEVRLMEKASLVLAIPNSAATMVDSVRGVFIQREDGYAYVPVELGREGDGWVEVLKGVVPGERVVTKGVFDLKYALLKESIPGE